MRTVLGKIVLWPSLAALGALLAVSSVVVLANEPKPAGEVSYRVVDRAAYADRLHGFWLAQSIANWTGLVTEMDRIEAPFYTDEDWGALDEPAFWGLFTAHASRIDYFLLPPEKVWGADDDTDIEYMYQSLLEQHDNLPLTAKQIRDGWLKHIYSNEDARISTSEFQRENNLWVSNESAYYLMKDQGLLPPATSEPQHNPNYSMIDAQLTTEIFGLYAPLRIDVAQQLAELPVRTTASGAAASIARFYVAMHAAALEHQGSDKSMHARLLAQAAQARGLLRDDDYPADMYDFVLASWRDNDDKDDWEKTRDQVYQAYQLEGRAGYQYQQPFDAGINFAASLISLFYGQGDLARTIRIGSLVGWDSDNPTATWGGLLGFMLGRQGVAQAFDNQPLSELYWIHRTRRGFADHTPDYIGEDRFSRMAEAGVAIVDRVVVELMGGQIDMNAQRWLIPPR